MVSFKSLSVALLAGTALAAPAPHRWGGGKKIVWHTVVKTQYVTVFPGAPRPTPQSSSTPVADVTTTVVYTPTPEVPAPEETPSSIVVVEKRPSRPAYSQYTPAPVPSSSSSTKAPVYTPAPVPSSSTKAPVYTPAPVPSSSVAPAPSSTPVPEPAPATGYMAVVDTWRKNLGLKALIHDAKLEANAADTVKASNGEMVHKLNPGSFGQVLAPGGPEDFEHCFVGGWLCERPNMPGMNGVCATASKGWYYTSTGHADILVSPSYSKIGCFCEDDIWACDVA